MKVGYGRREYACDQVIMLKDSVTEGWSKAAQSGESQLLRRTK